MRFKMEPGPGAIFKGVLQVALIIIIIIAIFIVYLCFGIKKAGRMVNNETSAVGFLWDVREAQYQYKSRWRRFGSAREIFPGSAAGQEERARTAAGEQTQLGYRFSLTVSGGGKSWSCIAVPVEPGGTGERSFYLADEGLALWAPCESENDAPAGPESPKLGE